MKYTLGLTLNKLIRRKITKTVFLLWLIRTSGYGSHYLYCFLGGKGGGGSMGGPNCSLSKRKEIATTISFQIIQSKRLNLNASNVNLKNK